MKIEDIFKGFLLAFCTTTQSSEAKVRMKWNFAHARDR